MKNKFLYIILFSFSFSQFEFDPRMLGMSGAYTSVASGYQAIGVNPANLVSNQSLSLNLFSANTFMVNDFLSVDLYFLSENHRAVYEEGLTSGKYHSVDYISPTIPSFRITSR